MATNDDAPLSPPGANQLALPSATAGKLMLSQPPANQYLITWDSKLVPPKTSIVLYPIAAARSPRHTAPPLPHSPILSLGRAKRPSPLFPHAISVSRATELMFEVQQEDGTAAATSILPVTNRKRMPNSPTLLRSKANHSPTSTSSLPANSEDRQSPSPLSPAQSQDVFAVLLEPLTAYE